MVTTHLHLVPRLRMSGAIPLHRLRLHDMQGHNYFSHDVEVAVTWGTVPRGTQQHHDKPQ
jgi:hypothetical protein